MNESIYGLVFFFLKGIRIIQVMFQCLKKKRRKQYVRLFVACYCFASATAVILYDNLLNEIDNQIIIGSHNDLIVSFRSLILFESIA